jgi:hypothetical protein
MRCVKYSCISSLPIVLVWSQQPSKVIWRFRLFSGRRIEIPPTVEVDRIDEVLFIPESAGGVLHPLDLRIERFTGSIGNLMSQVGDDVFESPLQRFAERLKDPFAVMKIAGHSTISMTQRYIHYQPEMVDRAFD